VVVSLDDFDLVEWTVGYMVECMIVGSVVVETVVLSVAFCLLIVIETATVDDAVVVAAIAIVTVVVDNAAAVAVLPDGVVVVAQDFFHLFSILTAASDWKSKLKSNSKSNSKSKLKSNSKSNSKSKLKRMRYT